MPETVSQDADLLIADVEDISWEDLVQGMLPDDPVPAIQVITMCSTCSNPCDPPHCDWYH